MAPFLLMTAATVESSSRQPTSRGGMALFVRFATGAGQASGHIKRSRPIRKQTKSSLCVLERRNPMLLFLLSGVLLLRFAVRQFLALLFQLPPRLTRFEPLSDAYPFTESFSLLPSILHQESLAAIGARLACLSERLSAKPTNSNQLRTLMASSSSVMTPL